LGLEFIPQSALTAKQRTQWLSGFQRSIIGANPSWNKTLDVSSNSWSIPKALLAIGAGSDHAL
jgi:hypothetical protein